MCTRPEGHSKWQEVIRLLRECIQEEAEIKAKEILNKKVKPLKEKRDWGRAYMCGA